MERQSKIYGAVMGHGPITTAEPAAYPLPHGLVMKLIVTFGVSLLVCIAAWAYFNVEDLKGRLMRHVIDDADRLSSTIRLGTHYAMMQNSRNDIQQIVRNISRQQEIEQLRIYDKAGHIKFSSDAAEVNDRTPITSDVCQVCHRSDPPIAAPDARARIRVIAELEGHRRLEVVSPILNEPGCESSSCHVHPFDKKVLGALSVVFSLASADEEILRFGGGVIALALFTFLVTSAIIFLFLFRFVNRPVRKLIAGTERIARGEYWGRIDIQQRDELGRLAEAINRMGREIGIKQAELNRQRDEYQKLFEQVPCLISVQDKNYRLIGFNREFSEKFNPEVGDYCYRAYKGRSEKCRVCPVEKTFADGRSHYGEETGLSKSGAVTHWAVRTSPIRNVEGEIVAAMEMSLDITHSRQLEEKLVETEKKYQEIFNHMPNPAFVLDSETLEVLDSNQQLDRVYGYHRAEILHSSFLDFFMDSEREAYAARLKTDPVINRVKHRIRTGERIFVDIWVSPFEYMGKKVLLVSTSDISRRLEAEQQLIQASKMATLGEMATGVAHELNQPLSVIKTASSFCIKKIHKQEAIEAPTLTALLEKIDANVDRATKIIVHMRQFARKTDLKLVAVQLNDVLEKAFDIFSQQLRLRGIQVVREVASDLPLIMADPDRLEQVFINLLINARDAIEERWGTGDRPGDKQITLRTRLEKGQVAAEVCDTGSGIPDGIRDKIFEPFFTTKEVGKGTGLGLSISYGIVKDCAGEIEARTGPGQGTCFVLMFPIRKNNDGTIY